MVEKERKKVKEKRGERKKVKEKGGERKKKWQL